jgi:hypothetical protein
VPGLAEGFRQQPAQSPTPHRCGALRVRPATPPPRPGRRRGLCMDREGDHQVKAIFEILKLGCYSKK